MRALEHTSHDALFDSGPNLEDVLSSAREEFNPHNRPFSNSNHAGDLASSFPQQQQRSMVPESPWNSNQQPFSPNQSMRSAQPPQSSLIPGEDHNFARPSYNIHDALAASANQSLDESVRAVDGYQNINNLLPEESPSNGLQHQVVDERALERFVAILRYMDLSNAL